MGSILRTWNKSSGEVRRRFHSMSISVSTLGVMVHSRFQFEVNSGIQSNICFSYSLSLSSFLVVFSGAGAQHFFVALRVLYPWRCDPGRLHESGIDNFRGFVLPPSSLPLPLPTSHYLAAQSPHFPIHPLAFKLSPPFSLILPF